LEPFFFVFATRILKSHVLSSLAKVFPALHAVKEYKDHVEATIEGRQSVPDTISLGDLLKSN
jgi:hypothetical protein